MDPRDETTWVTIELTKLGEQKVEDGTLEQSLRRDLRVGSSFPIFIPSTNYKHGARPVTVHLMQGYAFVSTGLAETAYFALERQAYVERVLSTKGGPYNMRHLSVIANSYIQDLRIKLQELASADIPCNASVRITDGPYQRLEGVVQELVGSNAYVLVNLRSLTMILTIPKIFLEVLDV